METGDTPCHTHFLAALKNSILIYNETGNNAAAIATRKLEIEVLYNHYIIMM